MQFVLRMFGAAGRDPRETARSLWFAVGIPLLAMGLFLVL